ncbi:MULTISPECIES: tautomerase family protein [Pseudonocardia]|uniref:tautomerase family protein n=1 Tax=Pseudonocardia TaxID=1847 RepID=UPI001AD69C9F|nr:MULTISPECIES: tautomerase family protein [Pseudonocardia]MBO4236915.1 4-oxalocrotonate tautomerase [Pseudonocardia alni]
MPLWTVHHSADCLRPDDRRTLAEGITGIYSMLPSFYVGVVFQAAEPGALFIGGAPRERFVRIQVDHIARTLPDASARDRLIGRVGDLLTPFMAERSLDWELHVDETSRDLWLIQGMRPPGPGTPGERLWAERGAPVPYDDVAAARP